MRRSHTTNSLVIISNHLKSVYQDRWVDAVFHYTGMGLKGHQSLEFAQNKTVSESQTNGITMYLFEVFNDGKYLYQGEIEQAGRPYQETQPDDSGNDRKVWIFPLKLKSQEPAYITQQAFDEKTVTLAQQAHRSKTDELKNKVKNAPRKPGLRNVVSTQYERNPYVAEIVKRRAGGTCELCGKNAPFITKTNEPYLESHHIIWLSREGEDSVENAVALCPNCHRRLHSLDIQDDKVKLLRKAAEEL